MLLLVLMASTGCDLTGQYEANFQKALQTSAQRANFDIGLNPDFEEIVDGEGKPIGVKLRLPKVFDSNKQKKPLLDDKTLSAIAAMAPKLGSNMGYRLERPLDDDKGQFLPVVVLFQMLPKQGPSSDASREGITKMLSAMNWTDVEVPTPEGTTLKLKRRPMSGTQLPGSGKQGAAQIGLMDSYLVEGPAHSVMISWIAPKGQADKYQLQQSTEAAMGTVQIAEAPAQAGDGGGKAPPGGCW